MNGLFSRTIVVAVLILFLPCLGALPSISSAQTRVSVGVTETMETINPYGDSVSLLYTIWCQIMGCLVSYDFDKGEYIGLLAERWEVKTPNTWIFHLRKNIRFHDGSPLTAADVVHSVNRVGTTRKVNRRKTSLPSPARKS